MKTRLARALCHLYPGGVPGVPLTLKQGGAPLGVPGMVSQNAAHLGLASGDEETTETYARHWRTFANVWR